MIDFEKIVASAMAEGYSEEDLAKQLAEALNKNKSKKESELTPKEKYVREVRERATKAISANKVNGSEAIDILASRVFALHPEWNLFCLQHFIKDLTKHVEMSIEITSQLNDLKTENPTPKNLADILVNMMIDTFLGEEKCDCEECTCDTSKNKSKEEKDAAAPVNRSDDQVLMSFLKSLGL